MPDDLTPAQVRALRFLDDKLFTGARQIGVALVTAKVCSGSNYTAVASAVIGTLRKRGLVTFLPDEHAWRISAAGRAALSETRDAG